MSIPREILKELYSTELRTKWLFCLGTCRQDFEKWNIPLYINFVDYEKAFTVWTETLFISF